METWLEWARGPLFRFCLAFMLLGLLRHVVVTAWEVARAVRRTGDKNIPYGKIALVTLKWLFPASKIKNRWHYSLTTLVFHVSIIVTPIFLATHVALIERGTGLAWPAIPNHLADLLTALAVVAAALLIVLRLGAKGTRMLSRTQDYVLPLLVAVPFITGFFAMHPTANPLSYEAMMLAHVLSANLILLLIPTTKLAHCVLLPSGQLVTEVGWHFAAHAGSDVAIALGKENEPV